MENKKLVVANQKMYLDPMEAREFVKIAREKIKSDSVVICPSSIYLKEFLHRNYQVGVQNIFYEDKGAYTGEISAYQASKLGVTYALVGHSERRAYFKEENDFFRKKIMACTKNHITPIFCVGENKEDYDMRRTNQVLKRQLLDVLKEVDMDSLDHVIIAYEPIWAIGTGLIPTKKEIYDTVLYIKTVLKKYLDVEVNVLYGGSVNEKNINKLNTIESVDGFLIGGASTKINELLHIIEVVLS
ncbi:MAG: triose-phosphate isomerase [Firmicutes bacterium]|nr:triose-phosphate isomerase [Bacillota bacterium]